MKRSMMGLVMAFAMYGLFLAKANAEIVYQTSSSLVTGSFLANGANDGTIFGDVISLAGTEREVTDFRVVIQTEPTGTGVNYDFDVGTSFFNVDGTGLPTTSFFSQTDSIIGLPEGGFFVDFFVPNVVVPDEFAIVFELTRTGGNTGAVGFHYGTGNDIGVSDDTFFLVEDGVGGFNQVSFGPGGAGESRDNLRLIINAVPEPGSAALVGLALMGGCFTRRRKS